MRTLKTIAAVAGLALLCASAAQAQPKQNGFSVILLLGETQAASGGDALPPAPAVRKALADVKDFLPYKSYRVIDTQWMREGSTRMRGAGDVIYDVEVVDVDQLLPPTRPKPGTMRLSFKLHEADEARNAAEDDSRQDDQLVKLNEQLTRQKLELAAAQARLGERHPDILSLNYRIADLDNQLRVAKERRVARVRPKIDASFTMEIGETVVVGTSKMGGGDKGLVVLLTAVAAGK